MGVDAIVGLVSLFGPKIMDMAKGLIHRKDSPEKTMASLAQTNPGALADYVKAQAELTRSRTEAFNQDMPKDRLPDNTHWTISSLWSLLVVYRGAIRPLVITAAFVHVYWVTATHGMDGLNLIPEWIRYQYEIAVGSWFGDRWK